MRKIFLIVTSLHLALFFWFGNFQKRESSKPVKRLVVKQFSPKPSPVTKTAPLKKAQAKPSAPKTPAPSPKPKPKPKATPSPAPLVSAPAAKPIPQKNPPQKREAAPRPSGVTQQLLKELEESIAKIEGNRDKVDTSKQLKTPHAIEAFKNDTLEQAAADENYTETLVHCLRNSLNLPEYGEVKIKLTLSQDGRVEDVVVLKAESDKNRRYLETHLPKMKFPELNEVQHTFVLTFCNEV